MDKYNWNTEARIRERRGGKAMKNELEQYNDAHSALMSVWKRRHKDERHRMFITDGIVCPEKWFAQSMRVLFLLKEAYNNDPDYKGDCWDLLGYLKRTDKNKGRIWAAVAEWQYAIENTTKDNIPVFDSWLGADANDMEQYRKTQSDWLKKCAVVNIKKSNGRTRSKDKELSKFVKEDGELLKKQIEIINPTIIVCGSTFHLLKDNLKEPKKLIFGTDSCKLPPDRGCKRIGDTTVIAYYHPANRRPAALNYYGIAEMYQSFL